MKRNYMLVYQNRYTGIPQHRYFETLEEMKNFIKWELKSHNWKVLHKYEIKEMN